MKIHCYFICWNEKFYIPFFHKHYSKFCSKITCYDQYSNDGTKELCESLGIEVRHFGGRELNDQHYLDVKNNCWKECRGKGIDYVIIVDVDEFLCVPLWNIGTLPKVEGFNMISESLPREDMFEITTGAPSEQYSKQAIFNPDAIQEINYVHGCHKNHAVGNFTSAKTPCKLYHYRMIGGVDRLLLRHNEYKSRMSSFNKKHNMGFHYLHEDNQKRVEWEYLKKESKNLF